MRWARCPVRALGTLVDPAAQKFNVPADKLQHLLSLARDVAEGPDRVPAQAVARLEGLRVAPGIWTVASSRGPRRARSRGGAWGGTSSVELSPACRKDSEEVCWWVLNLCRFNGPAHFSRRIPPGAPGGDG